MKGDGGATDPSDMGLPGHYEVVIVGGGISGLTAAWSLRDRRVCVLEASDVVGGRLRTATRDPYWLNLGAHVLMAGGPMATLATEVGVALVEPPGTFLAVAKDGRVVRAGSSASMLLQVPLSSTARMSLARVGIRLMHGRLMRSATLEAMTFAAFLGPMHSDVEALMRVVANRLTGELDEISAYVGVHGFHHLWLGSRLNIVGGSAELPRALQAALGDRIKMRARVVRIRQMPGHIEVEYECDGRYHRLTADTCVVAVPAPFVLDLIDDLPPNYAEALRCMRYTPFVVAGLFTKEKHPMPWDDIYAMAVPDKSFCMFFNPANPLRGDGPRTVGGSVVVYAVADRATELLSCTDRVIESRFVHDLLSIFPEVRNVIDEVLIQRWPNGTAMGYPGRSKPLSTLAGGWHRIAFAGDYMMPIDGADASESGVRAAGGVRTKLNQG